MKRRNFWVSKTLVIMSVLAVSVQAQEVHDTVYVEIHDTVYVEVPVPMSVDLEIGAPFGYTLFTEVRNKEHDILFKSTERLVNFFVDRDIRLLLTLGMVSSPEANKPVYFNVDGSGILIKQDANQVIIVSISGVVVYNKKSVRAGTYIALSKGVYILNTPNVVNEKIMIRR
jgi:hypothetical protein